jgi:hypothetical protein
MKPVISVKEVRKILGKDCEELDDYQIENIISTLSLIAREMLEKAAKGEFPNQTTQPSHLNPDNID